MDKRTFIVETTLPSGVHETGIIIAYESDRVVANDFFRDCSNNTLWFELDGKTIALYQSTAWRSFQELKT